MKKIVLFLVAALLVASTAFAGKKYVISVTQIVEHPALDAMRKGVADRLKEKGIDFDYDVHIAQGNMATNTQIVGQIIGERPDVVLAIATPGAQACAQKIRDTPIVFTGVTDPVTAGLVKDIANTGGKNITGMSDFPPMNRHMALIRELVPNVKTIGIIYNSGEPNAVPILKALKEEAAKFGINVEEATIANSSGVYQAAKSLVGRCDVIYVGTDNTVISAIESAVKVCENNKLPLIVGDVDSVARGAIAAEAVDYYKMGLQTGDMIARILVDGAKPSDMSVEFLNDLNLHVNIKAAKAMGVAVPQSVLDRAEKVIE